MLSSCLRYYFLGFARRTTRLREKFPAYLTIFVTEAIVFRWISLINIVFLIILWIIKITHRGWLRFTLDGDWVSCYLTSIVKAIAWPSSGHESLIFLGLLFFDMVWLLWFCCRRGFYREHLDCTTFMDFLFRTWAVLFCACVKCFFDKGMIVGSTEAIRWLSTYNDLLCEAFLGVICE